MNEGNLSHPQIPQEFNAAAERKNFSRIGLALIMYILLTVVLQGAISTVFPEAVPAALKAGGWLPWLITYLPQLLVGVPVCYLMLRTEEKPELPDGGIGAGSYIQIMIMCITVMYIGNIIGNLITSLFQAGNPLHNIVLESNIWATLLLAVIMVPITEELIFRRMVMNRLLKYGDKTAIIVSALLFALFHGNLAQFFYAFGLGIIFGYVYARTGKLRYSIGLHMFINFLGLIVGNLILRLLANIDLDAISGLDFTDTEAVLEILGDSMGQLLIVALYFLVMIILAVVGLVLLLVKRKKARYAEATVVIPPEKRAGIIFGNPGMIVYVACTVVLIAVSLLLPVISNKAGGAVANVACASARHGLSAAFIGKAGDDLHGHFLRSVLEAEGVDTGNLMIAAGRPTSLAFVSLSPAFAACRPAQAPPRKRSCLPVKASRKKRRNFCCRNIPCP
jgi:membrane protease YdiL (CAAX protease family)